MAQFAGSVHCAKLSPQLAPRSERSLASIRLHLASIGITRVWISTRLVIVLVSLSGADINSQRPGEYHGVSETSTETAAAILRKIIRSHDQNFEKNHSPIPA